MIDLDDLYARLGATPVPPEQGERPVTFLEREIWHKARGLPRTFAVVAEAWALRGALNVEAFGEAIALAHRRHDAMWTSFPAVDEEPVARLDPERGASLRVVEAASEEEARQLLISEHAAGFDLATGPLVRYLLVRLAPDDHRLLFLAHHIVCDHWALTQLSKDVVDAYRALVAGEVPSLRPVRVHNRALSAWQRGWWAGDTRIAYERFWRDEGCTRPVAPLRGMRAGSGERRLSALSNVTKALDAASGTQLVERGQAQSHSPAMLLLGALAMVLHGESTKDGIFVGLLSANRRRETISLVANLAIMLPLRLELADELSFAEVVERVRAGIASVTAHQDVPPSVIRGHEPGSEPYRLIFNAFRAKSGRLFEVEGVCSEDVTFRTRTHSLYDLLLDIVIASDNRMTLSVDYNAELIPATIAEDFVARYHRLLERLAASGSGTVATLLA